MDENKCLPYSAQFVDEGTGTAGRDEWKDRIGTGVWIQPLCMSTNQPDSVRGTTFLQYTVLLLSNHQEEIQHPNHWSHLLVLENHHELQVHIQPKNHRSTMLQGNHLQSQEHLREVQILVISRSRSWVRPQSRFRRHGHKRYLYVQYRSIRTLFLIRVNQTSEAPIEEQPQTRTSDPLQIAAQLYPWSFMTSTLDACFKNAESAATVGLSCSVTVTNLDLLSYDRTTSRLVLKSSMLKKWRWLTNANASKPNGPLQYYMSWDPKL